VAAQAVDPLPFGASLRLGTVRLRHILRDGNDWAANLAFFPDGQTLVSTGDIGVWANYELGTTLARFISANSAFRHSTA
jgi:hypothetical protein